MCPQQNVMEQYKFRLLLTEGTQAFLESLPYDAKEKISYNIRRVLSGEKKNELFKKMENSDGIWEFRTLYRKMAYRLFAFWDTEQNTLIVATHGIIKKTQKTPSKEIAKAEEIKRKYFEIKHRR